MQSSMPSVDEGFYYINKDFVHFKNDMQYTTSQRPILDLFQCDIPSEHKQKYIQFATLYHIRAHGHLMTNFERFKVLFQCSK
jgi:hypothetical protein